jgi:hypothetical protein
MVKRAWIIDGFEREEHRLWMFENRTLRRIFGCKVLGATRKMQKFVSRRAS